MPATPRRARQGSVNARAWGSSTELPRLLARLLIVDVLRFRNPGSGYAFEGACGVAKIRCGRRAILHQITKTWELRRETVLTSGTRKFHWCHSGFDFMLET